MPGYVYAPIVKGKTNDLKALSRISPEAREVTKPVIELMPLGSDKSVEEHLDKFAHNLGKYAGSMPLFADFYGLMPGTKTSSGVDATIAGYRLLRKRGLSVTPTYGFDRDDSLWTPLRSEVQKFGQGFCFRILVDDLDDKNEETWQAILERSADLSINPQQTDLLIDLRYVGETDLDHLKDLVIDFLALAPKKPPYRSIIVSGSSALKHVGPIPKDGVGEVIREELRLWMRLQTDLFGFTELVFSDYGIVHPDFTDMGPNKNVNAKIRYTTSGKTKIFRGHRLFDKPGYKQYHALSGLVRDSVEFRGRAFSDGDRYIDDCADLNVSSGNLGTWVFVDMNHHLELAATQMAELVTKVDASFGTSKIEEVMEGA